MKEDFEIILIIDKCLGLPKFGIHVGGGTHVNMPETWNGNGEAPPGWTKTAFEIFEKEEGSQKIILNEKIKEELTKSENRSKLTEEEIAVIDDPTVFKISKIIDEPVAAPGDDKGVEQIKK